MITWLGVLVWIGTPALVVFGILIGFGAPIAVAAWSVGVLLIIVLGWIGILLHRPVRSAPAPRDLCAHGCGTVHSVMCQQGTIIEGFPLYCERAYGHGGRHEAEFVGGSRCWPNTEQWRGHEVEERPPFKKMIL